ncbi:Hypothetical protein, putative [Bodo saltans]|uniref:Uncharacterized protein n=1 Tax=Bodo saltans TaxID=75058 RepID=A0A0S4ILJ6_BODSA|nr:Hypothetical protein, putative [Bodo saltans]|eukprot:CUE69570.1 Hypothetical protein, putative [Bodo saltans]
MRLHVRAYAPRRIGRDELSVVDKLQMELSQYLDAFTLRRYTSFFFERKKLKD